MEKYKRVISHYFLLNYGIESTKITLLFVLLPKKWREGAEKTLNTTQNKVKTY